MKWFEVRYACADPAGVVLSMGVNSAPVDITYYAKTLGINEINYVTGAKWHGACDTQGDKYARIYISVDQSQQMQRYTFAHQLGHVLMGERNKAYRNIWTSRNPWHNNSAAADFACELLMPTWMLQYEAHGRSLEYLANKFDVPIEMMRYKIVNIMGYRLEQSSKKENSSIKTFFRKIFKRK